MPISFMKASPGWGCRARELRPSHVAVMTAFSHRNVCVSRPSHGALAPPRRVLDQPAAAYAQAGRGERAQALPAVGMADGAGQRVCGVGTGIARQGEQAAHHVLHLLLAGMAEIGR